VDQRMQNRSQVAEFMVHRPTTHTPQANVAQIRHFFADKHVHMALIVDAERRLVTAIEREDLAGVDANAGTDAHVRGDAQGSQEAWRLGTLAGRIVSPWESLRTAVKLLSDHGGRRLAVVDDERRLAGLLCLKRDGSGFCSDRDVQERAVARGASAEAPRALSSAAGVALAGRAAVAPAVPRSFEHGVRIGTLL